MLIETKHDGIVERDSSNTIFREGECTGVI